MGHHDVVAEHVEPVPSGVKSLYNRHEGKESEATSTVDVVEKFINLLFKARRLSI